MAVTDRATSLNNETRSAGWIKVSLRHPDKELCFEVGLFVYIRSPIPVRRLGV